METNLLIEQYGKYKKLYLEESPYKCLLDADIEINPHQINAFIAAINSLKTGGIVLADEVGLGKTIEAGLVLKYVINSGAKRIMIVLPAALRKQWEVELNEKFNLSPIILDRFTVEHDYYLYKQKLEHSKDVQIVITSYDYSSKLARRFPRVKWDFYIIDEAHNLRNVFHGTKRAKNLYEISKGIPKILLTATPIQNSLTDLHGLISYIDPRIFGEEKVFETRYIKNGNYDELKEEISPVIYRTLRRDVNKYMHFSKRECRTIDFTLSANEVELYERVNQFLKKDVLYSIPTRNSGLITLVIRKLLASSSFALIETFEVLRDRLQKLYEGTKSSNAEDGFDLFWDFLEDEIEENDEEEQIDEDLIFQKQQIQEELDEVNAIIDNANRITTNAKIKALKTAIDTAFTYQRQHNISEKVVIFTESKRTQKYIAEELRKSNFESEDILLFNGDFTDEMSKEIYRAWQVRNYGKTNYGRGVEYKHAIVDYFKHNAKILIATDAGSEGLNLQFCNTVINYDLPWNPQKIEQRIGRCHRYGQVNDVVAINLLNTQNIADQRVYEILSKKFELFDGVFGASDIALGILESGESFEKMILEIYQRCNTSREFKKEFDKLDRKLEAKRNKKAKKLQTLLLTSTSESKEHSLDETKKNIDKYLKDVEYWDEVNESEIEGNINYWRVDEWGEETFGTHGLLFIGALCNGVKILFPVLLLTDEEGNYVDFEEDDLLDEIKKIDDTEVKFFKPNNEENLMHQKIYDCLTNEMIAKHSKKTAKIKAYNKKKIDNWVEIQKEQLNIQMENVVTEINELKEKETASNNFHEKISIRRDIEEKEQYLNKLQNSFHKKVTKIQNDAEKEVAEFNKQFDINPILLINIVLKF